MKKNLPPFFLLKIPICVWLLCVSFLPSYGQTNERKAAPSKLAPTLKSKQNTGLTQFRVKVTDGTGFKAWLKQHLPAGQIDRLEHSNDLYLIRQITQAQLEMLATCPQVLFVDVPNRVAKPEIYLQNADFTLNGIEALQVIYPQFNGLGLTASVKEEPFDSTDIDFKGRVKTYNFPQKPTSLHATTMATFLAGAGNSAPNSKGAAWQAQLASSDFVELMPDKLEDLQTLGVSVQNHSYGVGVENYYGLESQAYDAQVKQQPTLLHVFSSGNNGTAADETGPYSGIKGFANLTGQFKVSKNTLSVGAIDTSGQISPFSSRGPTYDGRIKPEVVAFGEGGTSEAAAVVSGVALVVQQAYQAQHNGTLPSAALVKAILLNTANHRGRTGVDFEEGFGSVDALGAVETIQQQHYLEGTVSQSATTVFPLTVPANTARLKVTLVWQDAPAEPNAPQSLVQDLDLVITHSPSGMTWLPWGLSIYPHADSLAAPARRQADHVNNVEQITLDSPEAGVYELQVSGYQLPEGAQAFSVAYELEKPFSWSYPVMNSALKGGEVNRLYWQAVTDQTFGRLEYRWAGGTEWQTLQANVPLTKGAFDWHVPDTAAIAEVRMVLENQSFSTGTFVIAPQLSLQVGYQCEDEFMLYWPKVPNVEKYQIYRLGEKYLEPWAQTEDTLLVVQKSVQPAMQYAVAPLVNGQQGQRSLTIQYDQQGIECYIKSFLARQFVSDSVVLDVELSTTYGVKTIYFERKETSGFQVLKQFSPSSSAVFVLEDPNPSPGRNEYRLRIVTDLNQTYFSQVEAAFYTPRGYLSVYPNPVKAGEPLQVLTESDGTSQIEILDTVGKLVAIVEQNGAIKTLSTLGWKPGLYLLRISSKDTKTEMRRVVVL